MNKLINTIVGCFITSIGVIILHDSHIVTGGTAGLSLSLSYLLSAPFGTLFFIVNIPFYIFSLLKMGWKFTLSTALAVTALAIMTDSERWFPTVHLPAVLAAVIGGAIIGFGLSILFMNGSSLGGFNIVTMYIQKRFQLNPGMVNFLFDFLVVLTGFYTVGINRSIYSVLSIAVTATIISAFKKKIAIHNQVERNKKAA